SETINYLRHCRKSNRNLVQCGYLTVPINITIFYISGLVPTKVLTRRISYFGLIDKQTLGYIPPLLVHGVADARFPPFVLVIILFENFKCASCIGKIGS